MDSNDAAQYFERVETQPNRQKIARLFLWAQAIILIVIGIVMTSVRTFTEWEEYADDSGSVTAEMGETIEIWPIGLALLCVGLLVLAAALVVEASRADAPIAAGDAADAYSAQPAAD